MSVNIVSSRPSIQTFVPSQCAKHLSELIVALVMKILSALGQQAGKKELGAVEMISNSAAEFDMTLPDNCPQLLLREIIDILNKENVDLNRFHEKREKLPKCLQAQYLKNIPSIELSVGERRKAILTFFVNLLEANS